MKSLIVAHEFLSNAFSFHRDFDMPRKFVLNLVCHNKILGGLFEKRFGALVKTRGRAEAT